MSKQVSEESSPFLADLGLADRGTEPFFTSAERFITFTFFSQLVGYSLAHKYHPFSFAYHSNIADQLYFLAYVTTNLVGRSNRGLAEMIACRPSGGMRENPRLPNNSCQNEIITAYRYLCIAAVQIPSLCEPGMVTMPQEWPDRSSGLYDGKKIIENVLI